MQTHDKLQKARQRIQSKCFDSDNNNNKLDIAIDIVPDEPKA